MLNTLSSLGLTSLAAFFVALPHQESSPGPQPGPAEPARAHRGGGMPSVYRGMVAGMQVLEEWGAGRCFDLVGVDGDLSSLGESGPDVRLAFEVRVYGQSPADARAAFLELEKALARRAAQPLRASTDGTTESKGEWNPPADHSFLANRAVRECFASVHLGTAQLTLSTETSPFAMGGDSNSDVGMSYIRSLAMKPEVLLGPLEISSSVREAKGWSDQSLHVQRHTRKGGKALNKRQMVNFLTHLETGSDHLTVSSLSFRVEADKSIADFELTLTQRVAKEGLK